jgi:DNA repair protein RecN (Recombination protein N)
MASASALDDATTGLVEIVGQHDQLGLTRPAEVRGLIDRLLGPEGDSALADYRRRWDVLRRLLAGQEELGGDRRVLERERDLVRFQAEEIARAGFAEGEDVELERRLARLRNAETLRAHLATTVAALDRGRDLVGEAVTEMRKAASLDPSLEGLAAELEAVEATTGDIALRLGSTVEDLEGDPAELDLAERRLQTLNDLRRKYGPGLGDVLEFGGRATDRHHELGDLLGRADRLDAEVAAARAALGKAGEALMVHRLAAATELAARASEHLVELGFADPLVSVGVGPSEPTAAGADLVTLLFASDARLTPGEIGRVASGGELSRLVLSLRLAGGVGEVETLVFDEIDAGVGGTTALAMGRKLAALAGHRQVLCVTHLPQVAAFADLHYVVRRHGVGACVERVEGPERLEELSRMLAGLPDSERGREAAGELLALAGERRTVS